MQIRQRLLGAEQERFGATESLDRLPFGVVFIGFPLEPLFVLRPGSRRTGYMRCGARGIIRH